jgi:beta-galactosidase
MLKSNHSKQRVFPALKQLLLAGAIAASTLGGRAFAATETFTIGTNDFVLNGQPFLIRCGEMHFARVPREYWQHRLRMARAMGLNTVCAYLFWNLHEPERGAFDFTGNADAAEFCRIAQAEGLKVILRPGPYSCAEWDFGGLPYWLLKTQDIKVRTQDPRYLEACRRYLKAVGKQLAPLQATHGGPIILVQVENEYGSFGNDKQYIGLVRDYLKEAGFDVPFFTCDGPDQLKNDVRDDIFCAVNFGSEPEKNFKALRTIRPTGPLICSEFYPGWFDSWGKEHHTGDAKRITNDISWMLDHNASFSIYMVHGGTTFGFSSGANSPPFAPQITSYDYDAPISEAGWDTPKFHALRDLFLKHLAPGETLPDVPSRNAVIKIDPIQFDEIAPLFANLPKSRSMEHPQPMEMLDQAHGCILYRAKLPPGGAAQIRISELHDYGLVFLDGKKIATLDRRLEQKTVDLLARSGTTTLDILVEAMGRVNYGADMADRKGITSKVELAGTVTNELTGWEVYSLPLNAWELTTLKYKREVMATDMPAFRRASFDLTQVGDTFLDVSNWGKGAVWMNGHNLGRFWNIGPQQTLYCPGPWLKKGRNEIVVLELNGSLKHVVTGVTEPILNVVNKQP